MYLLHFYAKFLLTIDDPEEKKNVVKIRLNTKF